MTYEEIEQELTNEMLNTEATPILTWEQIAETLNGTLSND
jgi:hypothetical protein